MPVEKKKQPQPQPDEPRAALTLYVAGRLRSHELFLLGVSVLTGGAYVAGTPPAASLAATLPLWQIRIWSAALLLSGLLGITGIVWQHYRVEFGLSLEQASMLIGAGAILLFCMAAFSYAGLRALAGGLVYAAWAGANLHRAWQIRRDLAGL